MKRIKDLVLTLSLLSIFAPALAAEAVEQYLIHSSGNVLGISGTDSRAALVAASNAKALHIEKQTDGTSLIASGELYLQLGTANSWSTYFLADNSSSRARYNIEVDGKYVRLKNAQTGKYLGTDDNAVGSMCYSDKSGTDTKHRWRLSDTPTAPVVVDTLSYPISVDAQRQICEGWGVSLCWWAGQCGKWSQTKMDELLKWMVSPTGLNWSIFRYNIGGGDDPNNANCTLHHMDAGKGRRAEMEGFQDERGGAYHWERDEAQRRIMLRIKELRPDAQFEAFSNSCPWWMTVSGCVSGSADANSDNLNKDYYEDFAHYLVDVCKHYKEEYGIEFKTLEPFNEANTGFWKQSGQQEGCHVSPTSQVAFLKVLIPILKESGLKTVISASDETNVGGAINELNEYIKTPAVLSEVYQWNTHTYSADNRSRSQLGSLARSKGMTMWMSETGSGGSGLAGNLSMTKRLFDDVRYIAPDAWCDWQYMEEKNDQWCMVQGSFDGTNHKRVKNYYVRQQVTRFIKPGYTFVTSLNENCLAAINHSSSPTPAATTSTATSSTAVASSSAIAASSNAASSPTVAVPTPAAASSPTPASVLGSSPAEATPDTLVVCLLNQDDKSIHRLSLPMARVNGSIKAFRTSESENCKQLTGSTSTPDSPSTTTLGKAVELLNDSTLSVTLPAQSLTTLLIPILPLTSCSNYYPTFMSTATPPSTATSASIPSPASTTSPTSTTSTASIPSPTSTTSTASTPSSPYVAKVLGSSPAEATPSTRAAWQPTALAHCTPSVVAGSTYLIIPQSNHTQAVSESGTALALAPANLSDPGQRWTVEEYAKDAESVTVRLRNELGHYATSQSSYAMKVQSAATSATLFTLYNVDGLHYRIMQKGTAKGWDLNQQSLVSGTTVGTYTYGTTATADTRQWLMVRVASPDAINPDEPNDNPDGPHDDDAIEVIYTADNNTATSSTPAYYTINGTRTSSLQRGINLVRMPNGQYRKVVSAAPHTAR